AAEARGWEPAVVPATARPILNRLGDKAHDSDRFPSAPKIAGALKRDSVFPLRSVAHLGIEATVRRSRRTTTNTPEPAAPTSSSHPGWGTGVNVRNTSFPMCVSWNAPPPTSPTSWNADGSNAAGTPPPNVAILIVTSGSGATAGPV